MNHPDPLTLQRVAKQQLPEQQASDILDHIENCRECNERFRVLERDEANELFAGVHRKPVDPGHQELECEQLIASLCSSAFFPDTTAANLDSTSQIQPRHSGRKIGQYRLIENIGEGGMGSVWKGQQQEPIVRTVAVKLIRDRLRTERARGRFAAERQAVALMDHPNIAQIFDAGETDDDQPYFVMEFVEGRKVTRYCDENSLGIRQRLETFRDLCKAVEHAHQKQVIHRDLKPANVLVSEQAGEPVVKVIDFGLSKFLGPEERLAGNVSLTEAGNIVGTIRYMAPEQAFGKSSEIDTRADIYSLGVILYELLTGGTPIDEAVKNKVEMLDILDSMRSLAPKTPSQYLSERDDEGRGIAKVRNTAVSRLQQELAGDLDWIVMKSIAADRNMRYQNVSGLRDDIGRYLDGNPVHARPPSKGYRLKKFVLRNFWLFALSAFSLALLVVGFVTSSWLAVSMNKARENAVAQERIAIQNGRESEVQKNNALNAKNDAVVSAQRSADILDLVVGSFKSTNPEQGAKADMAAREVLFELEKQADDSELDDPGRAEIYLALYETFKGMGIYDSAANAARKEIELRKKIGGANGRDTLTASHNLALSLRLSGKSQESVELHENVLEARREQFGEKDPDVLMSMNNLAMAYHFVGRRDEALELQRETLRLRKQVLGEEHEDTLLSMNNLGTFVKRAGDLAEAEAILEKTWRLRKKVIGPEHPYTLSTANNLSNVLRNTGRDQLAREIMEQVLAARLAVEGEAHPRTKIAKFNLAGIYLALELPNKAIPMLESAIPFFEEYEEKTYFSSALHDMAIAHTFYELDASPEKVLRLLNRLPETLSYPDASWRPHDIRIRFAISKLAVQENPGMDDYRATFGELESAFSDLKERVGNLSRAKQIFRPTINWLIKIAKKLDDQDAVERWEEALHQLPK